MSRNDNNNALTHRQQEILDFIVYSIDVNGYPPTLREIGTQFDISSTNGVSDHIKALERKKTIVRSGSKSRAIRPTNMPSTHRIRIPVVGNVAAGEPLLAVENIEDTVEVDRFFIGNHQEVFSLRVVGESMINDGIYDGDYLFVCKTLQISTGSIVVVMIEGEATVKRYYPEGDQIRFQPANDAMQPIFVRQTDMRSIDIIGVVVGVYRKI